MCEYPDLPDGVIAELHDEIEARTNNLRLMRSLYDALIAYKLAPTIEGAKLIRNTSLAMQRQIDIDDRNEAK